MSEKQTITVNGRQYDTRTGLVVSEMTAATAAPRTKVETQPKPTAKAPAAHRSSQTVTSMNIHTKTQRSQTLNRKVTKRPTPTVTSKTHPSIPAKSRVRAIDGMTIQKSSQITKFAPHPVAVKTPVTEPDHAPAPHPYVTKAHALSEVKAQSRTHQSHTAPVSSRKVTTTPVKSEAIQKAIENSRKQPKAAKSRFLKKHPRTMSIVSASIALVLLGGYLTYLNMPSLSVRVAAAQAGIDASYPNYRPDGYSLSGTVAYDKGEVSMKFAANSGPQNFTIKQTKSNWDSAAVLDKYVSTKAGVNYIPYTERGLTIYTYDGNAAWVNGGILYTIEGDAPLSSEQIRRIATSLI